MTRLSNDNLASSDGSALEDPTGRLAIASALQDGGVCCAIASSDGSAARPKLSWIGARLTNGYGRGKTFPMNRAHDASRQPSISTSGPLSPDDFYGQWRELRLAKALCELPLSAELPWWARWPERHVDLLVLELWSSIEKIRHANELLGITTLIASPECEVGEETYVFVTGESHLGMARGPLAALNLQKAYAEGRKMADAIPAGLRAARRPDTVPQSRLSLALGMVT